MTCRILALFPLALLLNGTALQAEPVLSLSFEPNDPLPTGALVRASAAWTPEGREVGTNAPCYTRGIRGQGLYLAGSAENLMDERVSRGDFGSGSFDALGDARVSSASKAWEGAEAVRVQCADAPRSGVAAPSPALRASEDGKPAWYLVSAWVRGKGTIRFLAENREAGYIVPPLDVDLADAWTRVELRFPVLKDSEGMRLCWFSIGDKPAVFSLDGLQLERSLADAYGWSSQWIPGGQTRAADLLTLPTPENFPLDEGSITLWTQPDWAMFPQYHGGWGWKMPPRAVTVLSLHSDLSFNGQLMFKYGTANGRAASIGTDWAKAGDYDWAPRSWHHWAVTWKDGVVSTYLDGSFYTSVANVTPPNVLADVMTIGSSMDGAQRPLDGVLDDFTIHDNALSAERIARYYQDGRKLLAQTERPKSDMYTAFMELRSLDGSERIFDAGRRVSFDVTPTPDMERRLAAWKACGLSADAPYVALFPDAGPAMVSPVHGRSVDEALADGQEYRLKIGRIGSPAKANTGRFKGLPAWNFSRETKDAIVGGKVFPKPHGAHTVSAWVWIDSRFGQGPIFAEGGTVNGFNLQLGHSVIHSSVSCTNASVSVRAKLDKSHEGRWLHVACVYDGQAAEPSLALYLDGREVDRQPVPFAEMAPGALAWRIGRSNQSAFPGRIDEVVIWDKALPPDALADWVRKGQPDVEMCKSVNPPTPVDPPSKWDSGSETISGEAVYAYCSFDETVKPDLACSQLVRAHYSLASSARREKIDRSREQLKTTGRFGTGVDLFKRTEEGDVLMFNGAQEEWDAAEGGAICYWFKPNWNSAGNKVSYWFWDNLWVSWMSMVQGQQVQAFAGVSESHGQAPALGILKDRIKAGEWCHYALSWGEGGSVALYLNGELVATNRVPAVLRNWGRPHLYIGCGATSGEIANQKRADGTPRLDAVIDDLLLTRQALSAEQIAALAAGTGPASDMMEPTIGFSEIRTAFRRDEAIRVPVSCFNGDTVEVVLRDKQGRELFREQQPARTAKGLELAHYALSPGRYDLEILFTAAGCEPRRLTRELVINRDDLGPIIVGTYGPWSGPGQEGFGDGMREAAAEFMVIGSAHNQTFAKTVDDYYRAGVVAVPAMHVYNTRRMKVAGLSKEAYAQVDHNGKWYDFASPFAPPTQRYAREVIDETVAHALGNPMARYLSLWDEQGMRPDVSAHARAYFRKKTGLEPPEFKAVAAGTIVDDNDPLARWVSLFGTGWWLSHGLAESDRELTAYIAKEYPGKETMAMPSSGFGASSIEVVEVYPYLCESPLYRIHGKTEIEAEINIEGYLSSFPDRKKQKCLILPGWLNHPSDPEFRPSLNVMLEIAMAKGCSGFCPAPMSWYWERPDMRRDFVNFSEFCRRRGTWFAALERKGAAPLAVLLNEHNVMNRGKGWARGFTGLADSLLPHLTTAGIEYELIREGDVLNGGLDRYRGLLLISQQVMTRGVHDAIESYAAAGHKVWTTGDSAIRPRGAEALPINARWTSAGYAVSRIEEGCLPIGNTTRFAPEFRAAMAELVRARALAIDTPYVVSYEAYSDDTRYVFVINTDIYGARTACITLSRVPKHAFELTRQEPVAWTEEDGRAVFTETLDAGDWRIYAFPPAVPKRMAGKLTVKNHIARYAVRATDADGKPVTGAWPLEIRLVDRTGNVCYTRSLALIDRRAEGTFRLAALTEPEEGWTMLIEDLVTGKTWKAKQ